MPAYFKGRTRVANPAGHFCKRGINNSLKVSVSEFIVKMITYPACYYCLFTSCKQVRLRKTIDKEYYSKGYILYLLVVSAKDYKVNVLQHYDKKNCIFPSQWFLIRSTLHKLLTELAIHM